MIRLLAILLVIIFSSLEQFNFIVEFEDKDRYLYDDDEYYNNQFSTIVLI